MNLRLLAVFLAVAVCACTSLSATKATNLAGKEICIVDNPSVRQVFRQAYENQIRAKGYDTKVVADKVACPLTTTYEASYGFHWGVYLSSADLKLFNQGTEVGSATYKAPFASPEKHGRVEDKIAAMVAKMLP